MCASTSRREMLTTTKRDLPLIIAAGFVRAMTVGFIGVVLAVLLYRAKCFVCFKPKI